MLLLCSFSLFSQTIYLRSGNIQPKANITAGELDSFSKKSARFTGQTFAVVQFGEIPSSEERSKLAAAGIELLDYLPQNAYTVALRQSPSVSLLQATKARAIFQLQPQQKMQEYFAKGLIPSWAVRVAGTVDVWISFYRTLDGRDVLNQLKELNADIVSTDHLSYHIIALRIAANRVAEFAGLPFVEYLQPAPPKNQPLNYNNRVGARANILNAPVAAGGRGLNGEGVVVGHGDNADVQAHADFAGRLINRNAAPFNAHGVHTAGTLAGAGIISELYRGYASKATLLSQSFSLIIDNAATYVKDNDMVITNNSYGNIIECDYHGLYDLTSRILDQQALELPHLLHVFSAGNSGGTSCFPYPTGYRTVLGSYQAAKNIVTVGATTDSGLIAGFSSRGPVRDGRLKPEIVAMGQSVISAWPTNIYSYNNGTSMSAPAVSGGLALLYQRYRQLNGGNNPKNGLMKAILCNGAMDKGAAGPDFQYGFGWMNLIRSVEMLEGSRYVSGNSTNGATTTHIITVPSGTAQLKVLLYWNDLPASVISNRNLVNDLDLEVLDPSGAIVLPKVNDTAIAALGNAAVNGADHTNNIEQAVIPNPVAGTYTLRIRGTTVSNAQQEYFVVYDPVPAGLKVTAPAGDIGLVPGEQTKISWDSYGLSGNATLEFSADAGATWSVIASGVDVARAVYTWITPAVTTHYALVRITKDGTGETSVSNPFVILAQPTVSLAPIQCEDYIAINWTAVPGATAYEVMILRGDEMKPVATTTATTYAIGGLSRDTTYFFSVRPLVNGKPGRRAVAISRQPNNGSCIGGISDKDVKLDAVLSPRTGRQETSTELKTAEPIRIRVKNLDDAPATNVAVSYTINGGVPVTETIASIAAGATITHSFTATVDLSAPGIYIIKTFVQHAGDANAGNDTAAVLLRQLPNAPITLNSVFLDNLETAAPTVYERDTIGIAGAERYDFTRSTAFGRLRTMVNSGFAASGTKAFTLDVARLVPAGNTNYLYGTFNLRQYNAAADELRLDFLYKQHGQITNAANRVWIRGSDTQPWIQVYNLDSIGGEEGVYRRSRSIELSQWLQSNGQTFTGSFQVRWGQWGQWPATDAENAAGYTLDDIRLYQVFNDVQMLRIDSPAISNCGLGAARVTVSVRNSSNAAVSNVPVRFRINNGTLVSETIASIPARTTVQYTFTAVAGLTTQGSYTIQAMVDAAADSFRENDTATTTVYNQLIVNSFPYLQQFESGDGHFYATGRRSSWAYGTPESRRINGAASGARAWKTNLQGAYNDKEYSYLYSPCFDITGMTAPTLSFSVAMDIEDCGMALCDAAWVEYSTDGIAWQKLGSAGTGTNWYNKSGQFPLWSIQNYTAWHVATQALPAGLSRLRLRWVMYSDAGLTREGIAIDDVHIYDNRNGIYDGPSLTSPITQTVDGNNWSHFTAGGKLVASVRPQTQSLGTTAVQAYLNTDKVRFGNNQYYLDRNLTIKPSNNTADSVSVRFYFLDKEADSLLKATGCQGCAKPRSAYEFGVSQYSDENRAVENGSLGDNQQGLWTFIPLAKVTKVPFDKGYYAEYKVGGFSEFWLNSGGADLSTPLPVKLMNITATRQGNNVLIGWKVGSETDVLRYEIEVARSSEAMQQGRFEKLGEVGSNGNTTSTRSYTFTDTETDKFGARYYRLKMVNSDGSFRYSPVRLVSFEEAVVWQVYPNPGNGEFSLVYQLPTNEAVAARLYDVKGRLVKEISTRATGFLQKLIIDISANNYATGMYLLRIAAGENERVFKLVKRL